MDEILEIIQDRRLSKNLGLFIEGIICSGIEVSNERVDTKFFKMRVVNEVRDLLRIINVKKHPIISAYQDFISETGLRLHSRLSTKDILTLLGSRKKQISINSLNDITDAVTLTTLVPIKALNLSNVKQPLITRYSIKGEMFRDSRSITWFLKGSEVVISDSNGDLIALIPFWVSSEHLVRPGITENVGLIAFGVKGVPKLIVKKAIRIVGHTINSFYPKSSCRNLRVYQ